MLENVKHRFDRHCFALLLSMTDRLIIIWLTNAGRQQFCNVRRSWENSKRPNAYTFIFYYFRGTLIALEEIREN